MIQLTEEEIQQLVQLSRTDMRNFEKLYCHFHPRIAAFIFRRCNNRNHAKDITQQVFLKAMLGIHSYEYRGLPFAAWLFRIALSELGLYYRQDGRMPIIAIETQVLSEFVQELELHDREAELEKLESVLAELDTSDRLLIEMRFFEKRDFAEIALLLNMNEPAVKMRCYRLLDKIKSRLK